MQAPPKPSDARKRKILRLKKGFKLNPEFKELWKRISKKTRYAVNIDTTELIKQCMEQIDTITIDKIRIRVEKVALSLDEKGIQTYFVGDDAEELNKEYPIQDIISELSKETNLTRATIFEILSKVKNLDLIFKNPKEYVQSVTLIIKEKLKDFLINGIQYIELKEFWQMELFEDNLETYEEYIEPTDKSIYDGIIWDSEGEQTFAQKLEKDNRIKMFIKLPRWFLVNTPIGEYNPDWAIIIEEKDLDGKVRDKLYLVRETKFVESLGNLRRSEEQKIVCAKEHFKTIDVNYKPIKSYEEILP